MPSATVRVWGISMARSASSWKLASPPAPLKQSRMTCSTSPRATTKPSQCCLRGIPHHPPLHRNCPFYTSHHGDKFVYMYIGRYFSHPFSSLPQPMGCADEGSASCARIITRAICYTNKAYKLTHFGGSCDYSPATLGGAAPARGEDKPGTLNVRAKRVFRVRLIKP